ncbi:MAG: diphthine--ammonia ligase [Candidatus Poseidoniaceae archaeon]|jgi:ABC transporter with metal-binding/Fe-S-binding domain ATP-binding protein|nr:diphthine--ammonia ligase [Candidatus Poseidoniaceae archaeon]
MRVAVLSSGGKDSTMVWWWALCNGWDVSCIVTVIVEGDDSMMFQIPSTSLVEIQTELAEVDWVKVPTSGREDEEINDLEVALRELEIDGIVSGALRSDYQKTRLERMCERLKIKSFTPIWHQPGILHMRGLIDSGFDVMISAISADGLTEEWLGHVITNNSLKKLETIAKKFRFNIDGEGGEYETFVVGAPHFSKIIELEFDKIWDGKRGHIVVKNQQ